tara:strand:+ start:47 stop:247 length:201 start_codon:yes stop_codon:yes gene_type:complete
MFRVVYIKTKNKKIDKDGYGKFVNAKLAKPSLIFIFNKIKSLNGASLDCNIDNRDIETAQSIGINL